MPVPRSDAARRRPPGARRAALLRLLSEHEDGLPVAELAPLTGLHPNTVRAHLEVLVRSGSVTRRTEERSVPGRPREIYRATGAADDDRNYQLLARMLAGRLAELTDDPVAQAIAAGRRWSGREDIGTDGATAPSADAAVPSGSDGTVPSGSDGAAPPSVDVANAPRAVAAGVGPAEVATSGTPTDPISGGSAPGTPGDSASGDAASGTSDDSTSGDATPAPVPSDAREELAPMIRLLREYGFAPELSEDASTIELHHCPFRELATELPEIVCSAHLGLIQGALDRIGPEVKATRILPFVQPDLCRAHLTHIP